MEYKPAIDSLVAANRAALLATPYLIVDVRGNCGGYTGSFDAVLPLLADGPIFRHGVDLWTSEANVAWLRSWLTTEGVPEDLRAQIARVLPAMEANPNSFVEFAPDEEVAFDGGHPLPRAVAVVVDRECASSCEDFVLDARQSGRVTVLGTENTRGSIDSGNVRSTWLPGWRRLRVPTSRSRRLPAERLNGVGIAPAVRIPEGADAVEFARHHFRAAAPAQR